MRIVDCRAFSLDSGWGPGRTKDIVEMLRVVRDEPVVASGVVVPESEPSQHSARKSSNVAREKVRHLKTNCANSTVQRIQRGRSYVRGEVLGALRGISGGLPQGQ